MKKGRKASGDVSVDVAYAEIFAEVQRLQALIGNIGQPQAEPPKQRKKRTVKPKQQEAQVEMPSDNKGAAPVESKAPSITEMVQDSTKAETTNLSQQQIQTETLEKNLNESEKSAQQQMDLEAVQQNLEEPQGQELTQQQIQNEILEKNLSQSDTPEIQTKSTVHKPRYVVSNLEEIRARELARQQEEDDDPFAPIQNTEAKTQESPSAVAPQEQQATVNENPTASNVVGITEGGKNENQSQDHDDGDRPHGQTPVGYASTVKAERLAKLGIDPNEPIEKSKLEKDQSGSAWGNWAESPADEIEQPETPDDAV